MDVPPPDVSVPVAPSILRQQFNQGQWLVWIDSGRLIPEYLDDKHLPNPHLRGEPEPYCTRRQIIRYRDSNGGIMLEVSQFLRPDGSLGASGKPDPKRMRVSPNVIWVAGSESDQPPDWNS